MTEQIDQAAIGPVKTGAFKGRSLEWQAGLTLPAICGLLVLVGIITTPAFGSSANLQGILRNASIVGIAAVGMSLVTMSGNFISLGVQQSAMLAAVLLAFTLSHAIDPALALPIVIVALMLVSIAQGGFVALGLNPVVATLAVGTIIFGGVSYFANGHTITFEASRVHWLTGDAAGISVQVIFFVVIAALATVFSKRTVIGREITLTGANRETARLSGVSTWRITIWAFVGLGLAVSVAGMLGASLVAQGSVTMFETLTIEVVSAVLVGGIAIQGGRGAPWQAAVGAVFIALVSDLLVLNGASIGIRQMVSGALVLSAVVIMHRAGKETR